VRAQEHCSFVVQRVANAPDAAQLPPLTFSLLQYPPKLPFQPLLLLQLLLLLLLLLVILLFLFLLLLLLLLLLLPLLLPRLLLLPTLLSNDFILGGGVQRYGFHLPDREDFTAALVLDVAAPVYIVQIEARRMQGFSKGFQSLMISMWVFLILATALDVDVPVYMVKIEARRMQGFSKEFQSRNI